MLNVTSGLRCRLAAGFAFLHKRNAENLLALTNNYKNQKLQIMMNETFLLDRLLLMTNDTTKTTNFKKFDELEGASFVLSSKTIGLIAICASLTSFFTHG
jgi:hypothetical protein